MAINFNDTTPSALTAKKNVKWQADTSNPVNISAYYDLDVLVSAISTTGTVAPGAVESFELVTAGASDKTRTLPAVASSANVILTIKKVDSGAGNVIVDGNASETIDGGLTYSLVNQYQFVRLLCDGAAWFVIANN
jgi:hypothetical protein